MFAEHFCSPLVQPVALPAHVRELLPVATTRALMAALILYVWTRPTFHLVSYPDDARPVGLRVRRLLKIAARLLGLRCIRVRGPAMPTAPPRPATTGGG